MKRSKAEAPRTFAETEPGQVVRCRHGVVMVTGRLGSAALWRHYDAESDRGWGGPYVASGSEPVLELVRGPRVYASPKAIGGSVDPVSGEGA